MYRQWDETYVEEVLSVLSEDTDGQIEADVFSIDVRIYFILFRLPREVAAGEQLGLRATRQL